MIIVPQPDARLNRFRTGLNTARKTADSWPAGRDTSAAPCDREMI